jgi:hypothetical protein
VREALVRTAYRDADPLPAQQHDFAELERTLIETETRVSRIFEALCPAIDERAETARNDPSAGRG